MVNVRLNYGSSGGRSGGGERRSGWVDDSSRGGVDEVVAALAEKWISGSGSKNSIPIQLILTHNFV